MPYALKAFRRDKAALRKYHQGILNPGVKIDVPQPGVVREEAQLPFRALGASSQEWHGTIAMARRLGEPASVAPEGVAAVKEGGKGSSERTSGVYQGEPGSKRLQMVYSQQVGDVCGFSVYLINGCTVRSAHG